MKTFSKLVIFTMIIMVGLAAAESHDKMKLQEHLAQELIRFHVRANTDSCKDQELKLNVKTAVVEYLYPLLVNSSSIDESREILRKNIDNIKAVATKVVADSNCDYDVAVYFENSYFPMKSYGDITLPPGEYEAFRIDIGSAQGKNWWCVLYPPLCFVDATTGVLPDSSKEQLKNVLTEEEYNAITGNDVRFEFKYLTFLNGLFE
ncbi:MAG: stage II sporulation protein R [Lachnospiraceae bacterium]